MSELNETSINIERLRQDMYKVIEEEKDVLSPKVLLVSQELDKLITEYNILNSK